MHSPTVIVGLRTEVEVLDVVGAVERVDVRTGERVYVREWPAVPSHLGGHDADVCGTIEFDTHCHRAIENGLLTNKGFETLQLPHNQRARRPS